MQVKESDVALEIGDKEHVLAMQGLREEISTHADNSKKQFRNNINKLITLIQTMAARSPKKRRRTTKAVRFQDDSDFESEDDLTPTPPPTRKKK